MMKHSTLQYKRLEDVQYLDPIFMTQSWILYIPLPATVDDDA